MSRVGFEPTIPVFERAKTVHALPLWSAWTTYKEHLLTRVSEALGQVVLPDFLKYRTAFDSLYFQLDNIKVSCNVKVYFVVEAPFDRCLPLTDPTYWLYSTYTRTLRQTNYTFIDLRCLTNNRTDISVLQLETLVSIFIPNYMKFLLKLRIRFLLATTLIFYRRSVLFEKYTSYKEVCWYFCKIVIKQLHITYTPTIPQEISILNIKITNINGTNLTPFSIVLQTTRYIFYIVVILI
jgi:hypothetical protein